MLTFLKIKYRQMAIAHSCLLASAIGLPSITMAEVSCFGNNDIITGQNQASQDPLLNCYLSQSVSSYSSNSITNSIDNGANDIGSEFFAQYNVSYELSDFANGTSYSDSSLEGSSAAISFTDKSAGNLAGFKRSFGKLRALTSPLDKKIKGSRLYMKLRGESAGVVLQINY
jgi:hypothetical protein